MDETKDEKGLTALQEAFCREFIIDMDAPAALTRGGYKGKHPRAVAYQMIARSHVRKRIRQLLDEKTASCMVDAKWALSEAVTNYYASMTDIMKLKWLTLIAKLLGLDLVKHEHDHKHALDSYEKQGLILNGKTVYYVGGDKDVTSGEDNNRD